MELQDIMGKNVKAYREAIGLTQAEAATMLGICRTTVQNLEKGRAVRSDTMSHIANSLKIPLAKLMSDTFEVEMYLPCNKQDSEDFPKQFAHWSEKDRKEALILFWEIIKHQQSMQNLTAEIMEIVARNTPKEKDK